MQTCLFLLVLVSPFLSDPWKIALKHPGTSLEVLRPHTEQDLTPLFTSFSCHTQHSGMLPFLIYNLYLLFRFFFFPPLWSHYVSAQLAEICMPTVPCFHLHSSSVFHVVCLNILMWTVETMATRMIYVLVRPPSQAFKDREYESVFSTPPKFPRPRG